jgi:hypothetical protein
MYRTSPVIIENKSLQGEQDTSAAHWCPVRLVWAYFPDNDRRSIPYISRCFGFAFAFVALVSVFVCERNDREKECYADMNERNDIYI